MRKCASAKNCLPPRRAVFFISPHTRVTLQENARLYDGHASGGLLGGINTYGYVGGSPLKYTDPQGLVKWSGEVYSGALIPGVGGAVYWFDLKSECVNGRYAYIRVKAMGFGAGFGARLTGGGSGVTFDDGLSDIFPDGFTGIFRALGANAGIGLVGGWTWYQAGNNFSDVGSAPSPALGFDFSIAGVKGNSKVVSVDWKECNCE